MDITVVDSIMGAGKTSYAIQMMNEKFGENSKKKFIYVTPFIDEVKRIKKEVTNRKFLEPDEKKGQGSKLRHLKKLIQDGENIVTTHSLFGMIDDEIEMLFKSYDYILILDEVFKIIDEIKIGKDDVKILVENYIKVDENGKVIWIVEGDYDGRYDDIRSLALNDSLYTYGNNEFYYWCFPYRIFDLFEHIYILTYQFKYQIQKYYYDLFNVKYECKSIKKTESKYELIEYKEDYEKIMKLKQLINIYEGKMNQNYYTKANKYNTELSYSWYSKATDAQISQLKRNMGNYFNNILDVKSENTIWSCYKKDKSKLKGKGYTKSWTPYNLRATNDYRNRNALAYMCNLYMNPFEQRFFSTYGVSIDNDGLALSTLLQWIFRSAIRDEKPIDIYIPSLRLRTLLYKYLNGEF